MIADWETTNVYKDLPPHVWQYIKDHGFLGMIIPKAYGGLGFSAYAHSQVITKLSTRSGTRGGHGDGARTRSGPASCCCTTAPTSRSATTCRDSRAAWRSRASRSPVRKRARTRRRFPTGASCARASIEGKRVLGLRVTWDKRYITLGPVATLLGLAFRAYDPDHLVGDREDLGITCALIPTSHPGVNIGRRHMPLNAVFQNGPNSGTRRVHADGLGDRRRADARQGLADADGMPRRGPRHLAAVVEHRHGEARGAHDGRLRARAHAVQDADRPLRGRRGSAGAHGRQPLHDGRGAHADGDDRRSRREAGRAVRHRQAPHHRAQSRRSINDAMDIAGGKGICMGPSNFLGAATCRCRWRSPSRARTS